MLRGIVTSDMSKQADLIVKNAVILCLDERRTMLENGALVINQDSITAIGITDEILSDYSARQVINADGCIVIPGLINAHTHIPMSYFRGLADDLPLMKWLQDYIWPLESRLINPAFVYDSTLHGAAEMLKNGITLCNDMYFYGKEIAEAISQAGMRGIIGEAVVDFRVEANGGTDAIGDYAVSMNNEFKDNPLIDFVLAPHSIYSCSRQVLERVAQIASEHKLLIHTHLSETEQEVKDCQKANGLLPVEYLKQIGILQNKLILAHGIWITEQEMELLHQFNTAIAICTESNLKLANGFAPISQYLKQKVRCCFATDGVASNNNLDLLAELDCTAKVHKNINHDPTFLPARQMLAMATIEAAKALHKADEIGSLEVGKKADLVILDCNTIEAQPLFNPYSQVIYALGGRAVRDVIINGKIVLKDKNLVSLNEAELLETAKKYKNLIMRELKS